MRSRNLTILAICQLISATGSIVIVTIGGIVGMRLAENPAYATLSVSVMVLGVALMTVPAAMLMQRIGRKAGFALAAMSAVLSYLLATYALHVASFTLFVLASSLLGINMAFTQQYRFAAAESVEPRFTGRAISIVLLGSIGGALLGPELISHGPPWFADLPFANTLLSVAILYAIQLGLLLMLGPFRSEHAGSPSENARPLAAIAGQPVFVVAVISGAAAYGTMSFIMTATPISMHVADGYSLEQTSSVIRSHVLGMYVPSLVSGYLLDRYGSVKVMSVGVISLATAILIGWYDHSYLHYWVALILLGVGWNFLYVGATTMLTLTYRMSERFRAQALNDLCVFGMAGAASLMAGAVMYHYGWRVLVASPLPVLLVVAGGFIAVRGNALLAGRTDQLEKVSAAS